MNLGR